MDLAIGGTSLAFTMTKDHDRIAFEAYMAIYRNHGNHVIFAAPSLDALAAAFEPIAGVPLDREMAQKVLIIKAP